MCKPKICKTISWVNQNEPNVNFSPPYANHKILVIPKSFTKSLRVTAYFYGLITCPTFLVQSGEVTFLGEKKVYMVYTGLHRFTSVCPPMYTCIYLYTLVYTILAIDIESVGIPDVISRSQLAAD